MSVVELMESKRNNGRILSVFCMPSETDRATVGFLAAVDDEGFVQYNVTGEGHYDGYGYRKLCYITRVDWATNYERNLEKLFAHYREKFIPFPAEDDLVAAFLEFAQKKNMVVSLGVEDPNETNMDGFVEELDLIGETVTLAWLDAQGRPDGFSVVPFESIERMDCDSERQVRLKTLHMLQKEDTQ